MKIVIFTSNSVRHKFVANTLAEHADDTLVIVECKPNKSIISPLMAEHFELRLQTEKKMFGDDFFFAKTFPILYKEVNTLNTYEAVKDFKPDAAFVFGSSIIKESLLLLVPSGKFINLHLGLSPYYRGSGTNFWPFVNDELDYVGATILHIDGGIDTGDIIRHVRPVFYEEDDVHTIGCRVLLSSLPFLISIIDDLRKGRELNGTKQWKVDNGRYYRNNDFNEDALRVYKQNLDNGLVERYLNRPERELRLV